MAEAHIQDVLKKITLKAKVTASPNEDVPTYYGFKTGKRDEGMGTTHISVVTPNMAVSVTSSIGGYFGSGFLSKSTGVLFSNGMVAFSLNETDKRFEFNCIKPCKRPLSAKCPAIVVDSGGDFKLVTGASGSMKIPPAVGQVSERIYSFSTHMYSTVCMHGINREGYNQLKSVL